MSTGVSVTSQSSTVPVAGTRAVRWTETPMVIGSSATSNAARFT